MQFAVRLSQFVVLFSRATLILFQIHSHLANPDYTISHPLAPSLTPPLLYPSDRPQAACEAYLAAKKAEFSVRLVDLIGSARGVIAGVWDEMKARAVSGARDMYVRCIS